MNNILFFIGLGITLILVFSFCLVIWKKEKFKLFKQQMDMAFKNAVEIQKEISKPLLKITSDFKKENDRKYMQQHLELKLKKEEAINKLDSETINKLIETGLTEQEAKEFIGSKK